MIPRSFELSRIYGISVWITHPLAMLGILLLADATGKGDGSKSPGSPHAGLMLPASRKTTPA